MSQDLLNTFILIAKKLNEELNIVPLLYGSLGLEVVTGHPFSPQDIDVLIPQAYLTSRWDEFKKKMESFGFRLEDVKEHEFVNDSCRMAFANLEELRDFADIPIESIDVVSQQGASYKLLNLEQFHKVYKQSSKDGYRKVKKNDKDLLKIQFIENLLTKG